MSHVVAVVGLQDIDVEAPGGVGGVTTLLFVPEILWLMVSVASAHAPSLRDAIDASVAHSYSTSVVMHP